MIVDAHVRLGASRELHLTVERLLETMDAVGIDRALVSPGERHIAVDHREGNEFVAAAAQASGGRLAAYAVASPWRGRRALDELERAGEDGAVALAVDSTLQGFDLLDGQVDPLIEFAIGRGWPVYVRTGTPAFALPLQLAELAVRHPAAHFVMGKSGATDFWIDARPALHRAANLWADIAYGPWEGVVAEFVADPLIGPRRMVFSTDAPYGAPDQELARARRFPLDDSALASILGGSLLSFLTWPNHADQAAT